MCLFPLPNTNYNSIAYKKGVTEFDCGSCPECLKKRSNVWALRSVYECKAHAHNCMITLTYDGFMRDDRGNIIGELPVNPDLLVDKRHIQLFIKRLRKWWSKEHATPLKFLCCAEYGSHTHRAHYHLILFGVKFPDIHFYKKSKRGNAIYMSDTLTKLWGHGICTVDSINVHSAVARYCTKYCAKDRSDKTFMLFSHHIGLEELMKDFNGINYMIDGREYSIPRVVWQEYILNKYSSLNRGLVPLGCGFDYRYINRDKNLSPFDDDIIYDKACKARKSYRDIRDNDPVYIKYLEYWKSRGELFNRLKPPVIERIKLLDDSKYHAYKTRALECYTLRKKFIPFPAPNSGCVSAYNKYKLNLTNKFTHKHLPFPSRPNTANDTDFNDLTLICPFDWHAVKKLPLLPEKNKLKLLTNKPLQIIIK